MTEYIDNYIMHDRTTNGSNISVLAMISDYGALHTTPARRHVSVYSRL